MAGYPIDYEERKKTDPYSAEVQAQKYINPTGMRDRAIESPSQAINRGSAAPAKTYTDSDLSGYDSWAGAKGAGKPAKQFQANDAMTGYDSWAGVTDARPESRMGTAINHTPGQYGGAYNFGNQGANPDVLDRYNREAGTKTNPEEEALKGAAGNVNSGPWEMRPGVNGEDYIRNRNQSSLTNDQNAAIVQGNRDAYSNVLDSRRRTNMEDTAFESARRAEQTRENLVYDLMNKFTNHMKHGEFVTPGEGRYTRWQAELKGLGELLNTAMGQRSYAADQGAIAGKTQENKNVGDYYQNQNQNEAEKNRISWDTNAVAREGQAITKEKNQADFETSRYNAEVDARSKLAGAYFGKEGAISRDAGFADWLSTQPESVQKAAESDKTGKAMSSLRAQFNAEGLTGYDFFMKQSLPQMPTLGGQPKQTPWEKRRSEK